MISKNQQGSVLAVALIVVLALALAGAIGFGVWASSERTDYKNNVERKIAVAVAAAKEIQADELQKQFDEQSKSPNKTYISPVSSGSVTFSYPKTWSAYVVESDSTQPINGYFHPGQVPGVQSESAYALRVEMVNTDYSQVINSLASKTKDGSLSAAAYIPPKMQGVTNAQPGTKFDGAIDKEKNGSMVVIKVRDKTLKIYTESLDFIGDFNSVILASLQYSP